MLASWKKSYDKPRQQRLDFANNCPYSQSYGFSSSHVWMWELYHKEGWAPKYWCFWIVVLEKTLESPLESKEIKPINPNGNTMHIHWKDWCWSWSSNTLVTWYEKLTRWENPWCWERLKSGEEGNRGWDDWMALPTQWTWVWANSKRQWTTGKPGVLKSMGLQRFRHDLVTEQQHTQWLTDFIFLMQWVWIMQSRTSWSPAMHTGFPLCQSLRYGPSFICLQDDCHL